MLSLFIQPGGLLALALLHASAVAAPVGPIAQAICPAGHRLAAERVELFLSAESFAAQRQRYGIPVGVTNATLMSDPTDAATCAALNARLDPSHYTEPPWQWGYYRAGNLRFISFAYPPESGAVRLSSTPLVVMDSSLTVLEVIGL